MKNITVKDIANASGFSQGTVMRVIHNNGYVSERAAKSVKRAIEELGYIQNQAASILKRQKTNLICHLGTLTLNDVFSRVSIGLSEAAKPLGYNIINIPYLVNHDEQIPLLEEVESFLFDGIITSSLAYIDEESLGRLKKNRIPLVMMERTLELPFADRIYFDDHDASMQAVNYLIGQGCRNIAYVGINHSGLYTDPLAVTERKRLEGYLDAVYKAELFANVAKTSDYCMQSGYAAAEKLMTGTIVPDGIVAASDSLACGILRYFASCDPAKVSHNKIVGSDNSLAPLLPVSIPSIEFNYQEATKLAVDFMVSRLKNPSLEPREAKVTSTLMIN